MKSKFLAGLVATIVALVFVIGIAIFLAVVLEIDASKNWFTYTAAFATIAVWSGMYSWLKPKDPNQTNKDQDDAPPSRVNEI